MGLKLSNLSQQAYVTKTGIPMFVLGMFKSLQYFKCLTPFHWMLQLALCSPTLSMSLIALLAHWQNSFLFLNGLNLFTVLLFLALWCWLCMSIMFEFLFTIPSTTLSMSLLWLLTNCNITAQIFSVTLFILILPLFTFCSSTLWFFLCASSVPISFLSLEV